MSDPAIPRVKVSVTTIDGVLLDTITVESFTSKGKPVRPETPELLAREIISVIEDNFNTED